MKEAPHGMLSAEKEVANKEGGPKVELRFYFSAHGKAEDFKKLEESLDWADIYAPESIGWSETTRKIFEKVARGGLNPEKFPVLSEVSTTRILKAIYRRRNKPLAIAFIDLPEDSPILRRLYDVFANSAATKESFRQGNFETALKEIKKNLKEEAAVQAQRENYIASQIQPQVSKLVKTSPDLKEKVLNKEPLRLLVSIGAFHTGIYRNLKYKNTAVARRMSESPFVFSYDSEAARSHQNKQELTDELAARVLIESVLRPVIAPPRGRVREVKPSDKESCLKTWSCRHRKSFFGSCGRQKHY